MDQNVLEAYKRLRSKHPEAGARTALHWARTEAKRVAFDWTDLSEGWRGTATIDGFYVVVTINGADESCDFADEFGEFSEQPFKRLGGTLIPGFESPAWREYHRGETCYRSHRCAAGARWYYSASGETFDGWWKSSRKLGRHAAWLSAMERFREDAHNLSRARDGNPPWDVMRVTAEASMNTTVVATTSVDGYSWTRDYRKPISPQLDEIAEDVLYEVLHDARSARVAPIKVEESWSTAWVMTV